MSAPTIEYIDAVAIAREPVKKQMWDGTKFVPTTVYKMDRHLNAGEHRWVFETYGPPNQSIPGRYWCHSRSGDFFMMDEQVYMFYKLKWAGK